MAATSGHTTHMQKSLLESAIKNLINTDLKELCKAYNYQVSGTKAILQKRCFEILETVINSGDQAAIDDLHYRVNHHGAAPPRSHSSQAAPSSSSGQTSNTNGNYHSYAQMAPNRGSASSRMPAGGKYFKSSPFYEVLETVLPLTDLPEMPQNRHTVRANLALTADQVSRLKSDDSLRLLLYCGMSNHMSQYNPVEVAFPNQIEVKINGDEVRSNFKGLKNKPGTTKPADITKAVRQANNYPNQLAVTYALTKNRFGFVVHLVKYINADALTERIKTGRHGGGIISKQKVIDEMNRANADPDIAATSVKMSLKDPISTMRINLPVRSNVCTHNQCFDGAMFMALQEQAPQWSCPVCSKSVLFEQLCVDKYFEEILQKTPSSIEKVDIEPNGEWRIIKEEDDTQPPGHSSKGGRASYDEDFDDIIEVTDAKPNGQPHLSRPTPSTYSPMPDPGLPMNTPPLSSRGVSVAPSAASVTQSNKRPMPTVIDLVSDDDEQPVRPAKRQQTGTSTHYGTPSQYSTPNSLPDPRYTQSYSAGQSRSTDSYRPSSNAVRPSAPNGRSSTGEYGSSHRLSSDVASRQGSPYGAPGSVSPSFPVTNLNTNYQQGWSSHPRPPSRQSESRPSPFQPVPIRQPPPASANLSPHNSLRLPPMQPHPPTNGYNGGWRSDYGSSYSHSPSG